MSGDIATENSRTDDDVSVDPDAALETDREPTDEKDGVVETVKSIGLVAVILTIGAVMIGPFLYMVSVSFMEPNTVRTIPPKFFPTDPLTWAPHNYERVIVRFNFGRVLLNTFIITAGVTVFNVFFDTLAGYVFAKLRFPGRKLLFMLILATLMVPNR
jgi:ABC-type glycerol-3-phosphate transport system permease component